MEKLLCPSMMCANFGNLEKEIKELEEGGIDFFHLDVMDGSYVPNFGMGLQDIETDKHACRTLQKIKDAGAKAGIALNPGTSFETVKELLYLCDYVMLMSVNPGFAGQKYLDFVTPKFRQFVDAASNYGGYQVMIDGACSPEKIAMLSKVGVKGFILGTSALFGKEKSYKEIITELRKL